MKRAKIIATLGPACENLETMVMMLKEGVDALRINFAHGEVSYWNELIEKAKGIPINKKRAREILYRLNIPKWIRDVILGQREWRYSKVTLWDFSQMVTYVATHTPSITQRYRMELQKFGGRLLEDEKLIAEVRA